MVVNGPLIEATRLRVRNKKVAGIENKSHVTKCVLSKLILSDRTQDTGHTISSGPSPFDLKSMTSQNGLLPLSPQTPSVLPKVRVQTPVQTPFRTALSLHRENATLHPKTANVEAKHPQHDVTKETG